jgi:GTP-binding protein
MVASHEGITDQDMRLLNLIKREGKPVAVLLGFWDLARKVGQKRILDDSGFLRALSEFHVLPVSGATGFNTSRLFPLAYSMAVASRGRVKTSRLNRIVEGILRKNPPPTAGRQNFNILYASQVRVAPPTFVFFMNRKAALPGSYKKYLENQIRGELGLKGQPVRVLFRGERG